MTDAHEHDGEMPSDVELQEPSTEKEPEEEPRKQDADDSEPSHRAMGLGVHYEEPETDDGQAVR